MTLLARRGFAMAAALVAWSACSKQQEAPPAIAGTLGDASAGDAGDAESHTDGGEGGTLESNDGAAVADAPPAAPPESDAGRSMTTRALLPTAVKSLLLDPFVDSDTAWGHFVAVTAATDPSEAGANCPYLQRAILSASPVGVSAPVLSVSPDVLTPSLGCTRIVAPFAGSADPVAAQVWLSLSNAQGGPVAIADDAGTAETAVSVALLQNVVPPTEPQQAYLLAPVAGSTITLAGRSWTQLGLPAPVSLPQGGWFEITIVSPDAAFYMAAPQVVAATETTQSFRAASPVAARPVTDADRAALAEYARETREHWGVPRPRRRRQVTPR